MLFLVELDHAKSGEPLTPEAGRTFIEQIILPTLARAEQLTTEEKIVAGGPVAGRIALRFIVATDSLQDVDRIVFQSANLAGGRNTDHATHSFRRPSRHRAGFVGEN